MKKFLLLKGWFIDDNIEDLEGIIFQLIAVREGWTE